MSSGSQSVRRRDRHRTRTAIDSTSEGPRLLFLGAYPPQPRSRQVAEDLAERLGAPWQIELISQRTSPSRRLIDQLLTSLRGKASAVLIDLFGSRAFWPASLWAELFRARGIPTVLHLHGGTLPDFAKVHPRAIARTLRSAERVIAPSSYLARELGPAAAAPIEVIANAIETDLYRRHDATEQVGLEVLWLRTFHPLYDPLTMIAAVARCLEQGVDIRLRMVGPTTDAACRAAAERAAAQLPEGRIQLEDGIAKAAVPAKLRAADVFVNTSLADNTPVTVIEALAAGCAVISSRVGGVPDLIRDRDTGLLVPPGRPGALAEALRQLAAEPALRRRLAQRGLADSSRFDWTVTLPQWRRLFSEVAPQ